MAKQSGQHQVTVAWRYYCSHADDAQAHHDLSLRAFERLHAGSQLPAPGLAGEAAERLERWQQAGEHGMNPGALAWAIEALRTHAEERADG